MHPFVRGLWVHENTLGDVTKRKWSQKPQASVLWSSRMCAVLTGEGEAWSCGTEDSVGTQTIYLDPPPPTAVSW